MVTSIYIPLVTASAVVKMKSGIEVLETRVKRSKDFPTGSSRGQTVDSMITV